MSTIAATNLKNPSSGSNNIVLGTDGTTTIAAPSNIIKSGTAVASTSGVAIDFTGIPSWVKRVTVMFSGVSTSGASDWGIRLGTSSGIESTGYLGVTSNSSPSAINATTLAQVVYSVSATTVSHGFLTITSLGSNLWAIGGNSGRSSSAFTDTCGYSKTLSGTLDRVRITTVNGTDTFDAGSINILYEG
jgi:hypothetical protein